MIKIPATTPSTARPVVTVEETFTLSNGKSPVRINHSPSKSIPRLLPAKLFVSAICSLLFEISVGQEYDKSKLTRSQEVSQKEK